MQSSVHTCHSPCLTAPRRVSLLSLIGLARSRRDLSQLSTSQLRDIGVTRQQADHEARRPIWDVPSHWVE